jgi:hypothetical protein
VVGCTPYRALAGGALLIAAPVLAQGTDQPPAQRDLMVLTEWLPKAGEAARTYDSIEQAYFEGRRLKPGGTEKDAVRFPRRSLSLARGAGDPPGFDVTFPSGRTARWTFLIDASGTAIRVREEGAARCDIVLRREAAQFTGRTEPGCKQPAGMIVAERAIWLGYGSEPQGWTRYRLARPFQCFIDVPGVGGGRAIPFKRFGPFPVLDQGGTMRITTHETPPRTIELTLRNVAWAYNNAPGQFTRNSLTMYVSTIGADGKPVEGGYAFGEPTAQRIGINLKHLLANCAMVPLEAARPEF